MGDASRASDALPERLPDLRKPWLNLFELFWFAALVAAIAGPLIGTWQRWTSPSDNSALVLGSAAGLALDRTDLTHVRFPVGTGARNAGVRPGDEIIAIAGVPVSRTVPLPNADGTSAGGTDTDYALFAPVIEGAPGIELDLTLRGSDGSIRQFRTVTGEQHVTEAARRHGLSPTVLGVVDLLHVLTYPFLIFAAWILQRRKREDLVSSILSLAILLTIIAEQPSAAFLAFVAQVPPWVHQRIYDLGNICLLAGIMLFPFGYLRPRIIVGFLALLPLLFFVSGDAYRLLFIIFMGTGLLTLLWRLQRMPDGDARQQIKWALLGFSGYMLFLALALAADTFKLAVGSFGSQMLLELLAGLSFGLAFLALQTGLLIALLRFRLYDAEAVISRSATFALITIALGGIFAATNEAVKVFVQGFYGPNAGQTPGIFAAAVATVLVTPAQERISAWSERRFQRNLVRLRDELPECVRDMRETASLKELLDEVIERISDGVRTVRIAAVVEGEVADSRGITVDEAKAWLDRNDPADCATGICQAADPLFPLRVPLRARHGDEATVGFLLIGPRPDGSLLSKDEQEALIEVADPIARAVRNVMKREQREGELHRAIARQSERIDAIERRLESRSSGPAVD